MVIQYKKQLLQLKQINGITKENLDLEIQDILYKARYYNVPVSSKTDLPTENNLDGEIRLVLDEGKFYIWRDVHSKWIPKNDLTTERRMSLFSVSKGQKIINTNIIVGTIEGISNLESVSVYINGLLQDPNDYLLKISNDNKNELILEWISKDFELDETDKISVIYDILIAK